MNPDMVVTCDKTRDSVALTPSPASGGEDQQLAKLCA